MASKDIKRISVTMPELLYVAVKHVAKEDKRSVSQEICHLIELAMDVIAQTSEISEGDDDVDAPMQDAIGFKVSPPSEDEDVEENSSCGQKKHANRVQKKAK